MVEYPDKLMMRFKRWQ